MGGPLRKYRYRGTVLKLNDQDAAGLGLGDDDLAEGEPRDTDPETVELPVDTSAAAVTAAPNKARTTVGKSGRGRRKPPVSPQGEPSAATDPGGPEADAAGAGEGTAPSGSEPDGGGASGGGGGD